MLKENAYLIQKLERAEAEFIKTLRKHGPNSIATKFMRAQLENYLKRCAPLAPRMEGHA